MTESDAIDNPLFENGSNSLQSIEVKSGDEQVLIDPAMNPVKSFAQEFAKDGPFFKLKIVNWVLILLLTISETLSLWYHPNWPRLEVWSRWYNKVNVPRFGYPHYDHALDSMANFTWIWLFATTFSLLMHCLKRKNAEKSKTFLCGLALMIKTSRLPYRSHYNDDYYYYRHGLYSTTPSTTTTPASTTFAPYEIETMQTRRNVIITRLFLDPVVTILAFLVIVLSVVYVWRIRSAIKRTNLWESDYQKLYPQCSKLDSSYAKFWPIGLLKVIHWIIPAFLCLGPFSNFAGAQPIVFKISTACCFAIFLYRWISYIATVRFRNQNLNDTPNKGLESYVRVDSFICLLGIAFYLIWCIVIRGYDADQTQVVSLVAILSFVCSLLANVRLMYKYNGFRFQAPLVSVSVSIKVNKEKITIVRSDLKPEEKKTEEEKNFRVNI
ncbi:hypothetical protein DdX_12815 [Ditylenchus destructor]|uniref:Uncharacterized protein n=1 Tax=Ditylenchus destructor TaxID=166010 RepID=A0AAD4QX23_9BILA|nr:hypothetical protein DdX_12815 [Ditylenchus destructor]